MYKDFAGHFLQPNNGPNVAQMRRNRPIGKIDKKNLGQMQVLRFYFTLCLLRNRKPSQIHKNMQSEIQTHYRTFR